MDSDDRQLFTNAAKNLAEQAQIINKCLCEHFSPEQADQMIMVWWRASVASVFTPDLGDLVKKMIPRD